MRRSPIPALIFAVILFILPFAALGGGDRKVQFENQQNSYTPQSSSPWAAPSGEAPVGGQAAEPPEAPGQAAPEGEKAPGGGTVPAIAGAGSFVLLDGGRTFTVSASDYVRGALAAEMPPTFHPEALKAQAVAAHTYLLYCALRQQASPDPELHGAAREVDVENWKGYVTEELFRERYGELADAYWQTICQAADEAAGFAVCYQGEPILAAYHSMSGGFTEDACNVWNGGEPYLTPVESRGDLLAPDYETRQSFPYEQAAGLLAAACPGANLGQDPAGWIEIEERSESGYVLLAKVGDEELTGTEIRSAFGLRSSNFTPEALDGELVFTVRGYGHGVGLSQYGADYLARQGKSFDEILAHYYPGASLAVCRE